MPNNNPQQTTPPQGLGREISRAAEGVNRTAERLESRAEDAASAAIDKVRQVREQAQSGLEQQRTQLAERIRRVGNALRWSSESLAESDPLSQQLFEAAGDRVERVASYVGELTPGDLASDIQSLSRGRPGLFFGGAFILGLALGRFAKSSTSSGLENAPRLQRRGSGRDHAPERSARPDPARNQSRPSSQGGSPLPQGVSGSAPATTRGSGDADAAGSGHGASGAAKPAPLSTPSTTAREATPGEGSKS